MEADSLCAGKTSTFHKQFEICRHQDKLPVQSDSSSASSGSCGLSLWCSRWNSLWETLGVVLLVWWAWLQEPLFTHPLNLFPGKDPNSHISTKSSLLIHFQVRLVCTWTFHTYCHKVSVTIRMPVPQNSSVIKTFSRLSLSHSLPPQQVSL